MIISVILVTTLTLQTPLQYVVREQQTQTFIDIGNVTKAQCDTIAARYRNDLANMKVARVVSIECMKGVPND
jgi:hypothetical protein